MALLNNPRHEKFAQAMADGKTATKAYELAGYKPNRGNASALKQQQSISKRVAEILAEREEIQAQATAKAIERLSITREDVMRMLKEDRATARKAGQYSAAIRAAELLGKELGMFVERSQRDLNVIHHVGDKPLSDAEWIAEHAPSETKPAIPQADVSESDTKH